MGGAKRETRRLSETKVSVGNSQLCYVLEWLLKKKKETQIDSTCLPEMNSLFKDHRCALCYRRQDMVKHNNKTI